MNFIFVMVKIFIIDVICMIYVMSGDVYVVKLDIKVNWFGCLRNDPVRKGVTPLTRLKMQRRS